MRNKVEMLVTATYGLTSGKAQSFRALSAKSFTLDEAEAVIKSVPKSLNLKMREITGNGNTAYELFIWYTSLVPVKNNARNESGVARWNALVKHFEVEMVTGIENSYRTIEEASAAINEK
jgi:hypothetical protein